MTAKTKRSPKIICISSGKGGVGKTSFSVNVATALSQKGKSVLLIDGDLGLANVDVVLGLNVRHTIRETIEEGRDLASSLVEINPKFQVLPASSGVPEMANLSYEEQAFLTSSLEEIIDRFDYVLIDTAAGIGDSVLWF
ncbi:MAG: flagellar synthesis regulator FleN, partial [Deltaproteobacteria bacterium HGW-Deltaproteobacteria-3]